MVISLIMLINIQVTYIFSIDPARPSAWLLNDDCFTKQHERKQRMKAEIYQCEIYMKENP